MASVGVKDNFRPAITESGVVSAAAMAAAAAAALQRQQPKLKPKGVPPCIFNLKDYEWAEKERPLIAHDQFENAKLIPVIDMGGTMDGAGGGTISGQMAVAAKEWGFFQVVGHGVPEELLRRMEGHARAFFELEFEQKKRILRDGSSMKPMGYACGGWGTNLKRDLPWMESLQLPCSSADMEPFANQLWLDRNCHSAAEFRKAANEFSDAMKGVALRILDMLLDRIHCKGGTTYPQRPRSENTMVQDGRNSVIRFNCYPPCPQPSMTLGLGSHSDPHLLTVLHQDQVGGLQICKDGQWITVKPSRNSLVINVGDALQVWSNDAYKSVEHRAVCNSLSSRLSMAFFLNPIDKATIRPGTRDPPLYRPFTWEEYRQCMYTHRPRGKSNLLRFRL